MQSDGSASDPPWSEAHSTGTKTRPAPEYGYWPRAVTIQGVQMHSGQIMRAPLGRAEPWPWSEGTARPRSLLLHMPQASDDLPSGRAACRRARLVQEFQGARQQEAFRRDVQEVELPMLHRVLYGTGSGRGQGGVQVCGPHA